MATPLLSVFMPAYNAAVHVREAVASVLDNGCADFELVVYDDGSTDGTADLVEAIGHPALRVLRQPRNEGVAVARARGIAHLRGQYLALLDADDVALPGRFERQLARLTAAGGPDILGGAVEFFGDAAGTLTYPASDAEIKANLLFNASLANPTVCMKLAPLREGRIAYDAQPGAVAEDYALWADALCAGLRFENLPQPLTRYRRHAASATAALPFSAFGRRNIEIRRRVAAHHFPGLAVETREALVDILSHRIGVGERWMAGVFAMARAAALAPAVPGIAPAHLIALLDEHLLRTLRHAIEHDRLDNDTLEWMTETNADFERWRMADGGALDARIVALFTPAA